MVCKVCAHLCVCLQVHNQCLPGMLTEAQKGAGKRVILRFSAFTTSTHRTVCVEAVNVACLFTEVVLPVVTLSLSLCVPLSFLEVSVQHNVKVV